jgi:hypothetical protein
MADADWRYDPARTTAGQLQRGLGRGAVEVRDADLVYACVRRDHRWWWCVDERAVYLARLIRDLGLSITPLVERLHATDPDDDNEFENTLEVLEVLGRVGVDGVVDEVRRYVIEGRHPQEVLAAVAHQWPAEYWADLVPAKEQAGHLAPRPAAGPADLEMTPVRQTWAWFRTVAAHGDESDVPLLLDGVAWLDGRADRCGYDVLVDGLARIGGPGTAGVPKLLRRLWLTPHSYERASYLRAQLVLDREGAEYRLREGLWDCEREVRLLAAQHVSLTPLFRDRLTYLRDDPIETPEVRGAAAARLTA